MDEQAAIAGTKAGDQRAFGWIVERYQHMVYTVCSRVLREREDAEEATQDSFVKAYQHMGTYGGEAKFSTWLYSIAYRTAISKLRTRKGASVDLDEVPEAFLGSEPSAVHDQQDRKQALDQALAQLSAEDATVVTLYYLAEQNVEEIVTATGLSASNVKVKLHRSRKKLQEILHAQFKEETWTLR